MEKIDEFKGKLESVGIPSHHGVFVSVSGFTADAMDRAGEVGIRTFLLTGLTPDRLAAEIQQALQSIVYLLLETVSVVITSDAPGDQGDVMLLLEDDKGEPRGYVMDLIWAKWRDGHIPLVIGTHDIEINLLVGWQWAVERSGYTGAGRATVRVLGLVISTTGQSERYILTDAASGSVERLNVRSSFHSEQRAFPITTVESEENLTAILNTPSVLTVTVGRIPLPRIRYGPMYWPPSRRALRPLCTLPVRWRTTQRMGGGITSQPLPDRRVPIVMRKPDRLLPHS